MNRNVHAMNDPDRNVFLKRGSAHTCHIQNAYTNLKMHFSGSNSGTAMEIRLLDLPYIKCKHLYFDGKFFFVSHCFLKPWTGCLQFS